VSRQCDILLSICRSGFWIYSRLHDAADVWHRTNDAVLYYFVSAKLYESKRHLYCISILDYFKGTCNPNIQKS